VRTRKVNSCEEHFTSFNLKVIGLMTSRCDVGRTLKRQTLRSDCTMAYSNSGGTADEFRAVRPDILMSGEQPF